MTTRRTILLLGLTCAPLVPKCMATAKPAAVAPAAPVESSAQDIRELDFNQIMGTPNTYGWWTLGRKDGEPDDFETFAREYEQWAREQAEGCDQPDLN